MARIFNIYFTYEEVTHNAVISVRETPFFTEYTVMNFDEELMKQLPGTKIISRSPGDFIFLNVDVSLPTLLMHIILKAMREHLEVVKV